MQANKAVVQGLQGQLAEQRTQFGAESTAQNAQVEGLQQSLAAKTQQHDKLAADHSNALQVCFYIMYALMQFCDDELCCCLCASSVTMLEILYVAATCLNCLLC